MVTVGTFLRVFFGGFASQMKVKGSFFFFSRPNEIGKVLNRIEQSLKKCVAQLSNARSPEPLKKKQKKFCQKIKLLKKKTIFAKINSLGSTWLLKNKLFSELSIFVFKLLYLLGCAPSIKDQVDAEIKVIVFVFFGSLRSPQFVLEIRDMKTR